MQRSAASRDALVVGLLRRALDDVLADRRFRERTSGSAIELASMSNASTNGVITRVQIAHAAPLLTVIATWSSDTNSIDGGVGRKSGTGQVRPVRI